MIKSLNKIAIVLASALAVSCDFLDQKEYVYQSSEYQFSTFENTEKVLSNVYGYLNKDLPWQYSTFSCATDEGSYAWDSNGIKAFYDGTWSPVSLVADNFSYYCNAITAANYFLENVPDDFPDSKYVLDYADRMIQLKNFPHEAKFLRAFFHFELLRRYNNIVILDRMLTPEEANSISPVDFQTAASWIADECDAVKDLLPDTYANFPTGRTNRVTKGAAMALKSKVLLYAASKLNNPDNDKEKWEKAAAAAKELIDLNLYQLVDEEVVNNFDAKGYIFGVITNASNSFESANFPIGVEGGNSGCCPSQNLAEAFDLLDGTPFDWNNADHRAVALDPSKRDPRFGKTLYVNGALFKGEPLEMFYGGQNALPKDGGTRTSYYQKKFCIEETSFVTGNSKSFTHVYPIFRYAEIFLNYAEALYEATSDPEFTGTLNGVDFTMSPLEAMNRVRQRAGVGLVTDTGNFRERLRKERMVELAFENQRFWDVRRWCIGKQTEDIYGLSLTQNPDDGSISMEKSVIQEHPWQDKYSYFPYSDAELVKNRHLIQNDGW